MVDAGFYNLMVGLGESYFPAFALALGLGEGSSGLMATLPMLIGATIQIFTPWALRRVSSNRRWVVTGASIQALSVILLPLAAAVTGSLSAVLAFGFATFYWAGNMATAPAWNVWMEDVIPKQIRTRFFGGRGRISQFCLVIAFCSGGFALQWGREHHLLLPLFATIFVAAGLFRLVSASQLASQSEPRTTDGAYHWVSPLELFKSRKGSSGGSLVLFLLCVQVAAQISGPYFAPYMLAEKGYEYSAFTMMMGVTFLAKTIAMPYWGRLGQRIGAQKLLWVGAVMVVPISGLWMALSWFEAMSMHVDLPLPGGRIWSTTIGAQVLYITLIQIISGVAWSAFELATALMFFEGIPREKRGYLLNWYNWGNAAAMAAGSLIGVTVLKTLGETEGTYLFLFGLSSVARFAVVATFFVRRASAATTA